MFKELAVLRELLVLVLATPPAPPVPGARLLATAANVSRRDAAEDS